MKRYAFIAFAVLISFSGYAQIERVRDFDDGGKKNAFEIITHSKGLGSGDVQFHQDIRIEDLVINNAAQGTKELQGYRVQVFSSNEQRTAKDEAFKIEQRLKQGFPLHNVYVSYTSPFWKVRLGDFETQDEARMFAEEVAQKFPSLRNHTYTVRDRITLIDK